MGNHIVLIDDDDDDQFIFLTALRLVAPGCACRICKNGLDGIRDLQADHDNVDLIFLDLNMPIMNGFEFLTV
jgi:CheY-like chemotaxis protein